MDYKISVIVPIHNVAKYIGESLDSILNQTIGHENLQVIMVDDGSTDESPAIMEEYSKKYPNFISKRLPTKSGSAGKPRNIGLELATGKYVMFIDPDDFYTKDACKMLYDRMEACNADVITANYQYVDEDGTPWPNPVFSKSEFEDFKFGHRGFRKTFFVWNSSVCNKIFRRSLITENNLKFLEGCPAEDAYFSSSALLKTDEIYYCSEIMYNYRRRNLGSLSVSWNCSYEYFKNINYAYRKIYELFKAAGRLDYYRYFYAKSQTYMLYKFIDSTMMDDEEKKAVIREMAWFYNISDKLKIEPCQKSLKILIQKISEEKYDEVVDVCKIIADMRSYIPESEREKMSKPTDILYERLEDKE